jgi:NADH dehydrogenase
MTQQDLHVVTGAFGYSGRHIAARLLQAGHRVRTLTNSPDRPNPFGDRVEAHPFHFDQPDKLADSLRGAAALYNTYWVRYNARDFTHAEAIENTQRLFIATKAAGVGRVVHVSITNPSEDCDLEYFRGKARLERALIESGLSYAILRPALLFGEADILVNNIAWTLRHLPVFGVFGSGDYRLQPIHVDDLAALAVEQGAGHDNVIVDAIGPETFTYRQLVETIAAAIGKPRPILRVPPAVGYLVGRLVGFAVGDMTITRDEIASLMRGMLCTNSPPAGSTRLSEWTREHADTLGRRYASELARRRNRRQAYENL